ncbi:Lrp/AsnC family transcriptional regulator [Nocardioides sp. R1-1]|uniref:Lrp/AsnC family transcriptional regulator n=1 Tax=Nocardioides sp. R1-1 TaxID=3383502 RepID=UPI0038CFFFC4
MSAALQLDQLDRLIVGVLLEDGRATFAQIGDRVGLSAPAVKRRVDRLVSSGAITGFTVRVDPSVVGWSTEGYVEIYCRGSTSPAEILKAVDKHPEVVSASTVTGEADAILHILASDIRHFEQVVERIASEPFLVRTKSELVLSPLVRREQGSLPD